MRNVYDVLKERGFIEQATHEEEIRELLGKESVTFYIGYDATADSLTIGHFLTIMAMMHLQEYGHRPITLMGGGTTMVGDPSDRTGMRSMMTIDTINQNVQRFKDQISKFIEYGDDKAIMSNNADWLLKLNYVEFLRDFGVHFSVNRMLSAECYKSRMEKGLTFLEFNYMIMQSYDFYELYKRHNCKVQFGGNDQWSNILGGVDLVRRKESAQVYGMTFALLTTSEGKKMGKSEKGAIWLDPNKTSPFEFFQYFRNVADADVKKCLSLLTFLPMDEVNRLSSLEDAEINKAKEILAFEVTKIVHGEEEAKKALDAAKALFSGGSSKDNIPSSEMSTNDLVGKTVNDILVELSLVPSKSEGRRAIQQGGVKINDVKVEDVYKEISNEDIKDNEILIQKGKKNFHLIKLV